MTQNFKPYLLNCRALGSAVFICLYFFLFFDYSAQIETQASMILNKKYAFNDPRNPNCPCHTYQRKATHEYFKLNKIKKEASVERTTSEPLKNKPSSKSLIFVKLFKRNLYSAKNAFNKKRNRKSFKIRLLNKDKLALCPNW